MVAAIAIAVETTRRVFHFHGRKALGEKDDSGLLEYVVRFDNAKMLFDVLAAGADIATDGPAALASAAWSGRSIAAAALLRAGADPNGRDGRPLIFAVNRGHAEVVRLLIAAGADVALSEGRALFEAARRGEVALCKLLLSCGADPRQDRSLQAAASDGHVDVVWVLESAKSHFVEKSGQQKHRRRPPPAVDDAVSEMAAISGSVVVTDPRQTDMFDSPGADGCGPKPARRIPAAAQSRRSVRSAGSSRPPTANTVNTIDPC